MEAASPHRESCPACTQLQLQPPSHCHRAKPLPNPRLTEPTGGGKIIVALSLHFMVQTLLIRANTQGQPEVLGCEFKVTHPLGPARDNTFLQG